MILNYSTESQALFASAEPPIAKEGVSGFQLLCQYLSKPGETVFLVTWSRLQKNDVTVIFEKRFPIRNTFENYTFFDSWKRREAKHNVMTFADVSIADGEVTRHDAGTYRCEVITDVNRLHGDVNVTVLCEFFPPLFLVQNRCLSVSSSTSSST